VVTLAGNFDIFAPGTPTGLAAILLAGCHFTNAWNVSALGFALIFYLKVSPFLISVLLDM